MPYETHCVFCQRNMEVTDSGKFPTICTICWETYPDGITWENGLGLEIAKQLKGSGIVDVSAWNSV